MDCASLRLQSGAQRANAGWQSHTSRLGGSYSKEPWPSQVEGKEHLVQLQQAWLGERTWVGPTSQTPEGRR